MDEKYKILLGEEDFIARDNEDLYLNINLNRTFSEYKKERYDNDFDLSEQFKKERNASRDFRVYGIVDSNVIDTSNIPIRVYSDSGTTNFITQVQTTNMNFGHNINVFNKKVGKYYLKLNNFTGTSVYFKIMGNNDFLATQVFEQKLVFYDSDNQFISYGTNNVDLDDNLNSIEINNDFPFFYNKHWVKKNISLQETKYPVINFSGSSYTLKEGQKKDIIIFLDKPSPFGNEKFEFSFATGGTATNLSDFLVYENSTSNIFPGTVQLQFAPGEQYKKISFSASTDNTVEVIEYYDFVLKNFVKVKPGISLNYRINIESVEQLKYANYEITNLFENRAPFVGITNPSLDASSFLNSTISNSNTFVLNSNPPLSAPSVIRNGLFYNAAQNEFYPLDEVEVEITNSSTATTIFPAVSGLGNTTDEFWFAGQSKFFTFKPQYTGASFLNEVHIKLPPTLNNTVSLSMGSIFGSLPNSSLKQSAIYVLGNLSINGFKLKIDDINNFQIPLTTPSSYSVCYDCIKKLIGGGSLDIYQNKGIFKPFTVTFDDANYTVKLKAKSFGVRIDVNNNVHKLSSTALPSVSIIMPYEYPTQLPFKFKLVGNINNGYTSKYTFKFRKPGYKDLIMFSTAQASVNGTDNFLVTAVNNILHTWDELADSGNGRPIAYSGTPFIFPDFNAEGKVYLPPTNNLYYKGLLLLNTFDVNENSSIKNLTKYGTDDFTLSTSPLVVDSARWYQNPLPLLEKTYKEFSNQTVKQKSMLRIKTPPNVVGLLNSKFFYSFDFSNGNSSSYSSFYWMGGVNAIKVLNPSLASTQATPYISGTTITTPRTSLGVAKELNFGNTSTPFVAPGPVNITKGKAKKVNNFYSPYYPSPYLASSSFPFINYMLPTPTDVYDLVFESKVAGTPFYIKNIINREIVDPTTSNSNAELIYMPIYYNEIQGVTKNPYNNFMGGFSLIPL